MKSGVPEFARDESGGALIEYALVLALVSLVAMGALSSFGDVLEAFLNQTTSTLAQVAQQAK